MIPYGIAFVIGYLFSCVCSTINGQRTLPWSPRLTTWGLVFMGLNWVATLGGQG